MKVLVLNNAAPFIRGGAEELADNLVLRLNGVSGVRAELLRVPFSWSPSERIIDEILLNQSLRLINVDRVIALKFPAYLIPHHNKILWLLHQFRQAYDLHVPGYSHIGFDEEGRKLVEAIKRADQECFKACRRIFTNSPVTLGRLKRYNNFDGTVLYPPLNDPERFGGGEAGNYIFAGGRVSRGKRQHLLVEAMSFVRSDVALIVAGPPDDETYAAELLASARAIGDRIDVRLGFRPRSEIAALVNGSLACAYLPIDEDSLGYVAMESACAAKPLITANDSGGVLDLVDDGHSGFVVAPDPRAIAARIDELAFERARAARLGSSAKAQLDRKAITWNHVIDQLLA